MSHSIEPGHYVLVVDVVNPKPDRRRRDWDSLPTWPKGLRLVVRERASEIVEILESNAGLHARGGVHELMDPERFEAIRPRLRRIADTARSIYAELGMFSTHPDAVAQALVDRGLVTLAQLRAVCERLNEDEPTPAPRSRRRPISPRSDAGGADLPAEGQRGEEGD